MNDLKILVIDDKEVNIETAKQLIDSWNNNDDFINQPYGPRNKSFFDRINNEFDKKPNINIIPKYLSDGKSALEVLEKENFKAVISDVFFHFENDKTSKSIKDKIVDIIGDHIHGYEDESSKWIEGNEIPPTGILIAEKILKNNPNTIMVLNTFIHHHADLGEPISSWSRKNDVEYVDRNANYLSKRKAKEQDVDSFDVLFSSEYENMDYIAKDWRDALLKVILKL